MHDVTYLAAALDRTAQCGFGVVEPGAQILSKKLAEFGLSLHDDAVIKTLRAVACGMFGFLGAYEQAAEERHPHGDAIEMMASMFALIADEGVGTTAETRQRLEAASLPTERLAPRVRHFSEAALEHIQQHGTEATGGSSRRGA